MTISSDLRASRQRQLVDAAHTLIRVNEDAGFSMIQLAKQAGVSPATPYNLLGSKAEILRLVVIDEFEGFKIKLATIGVSVGLARLLQAVDLLVQHYVGDPRFYAGLYKAAQTAETSQIGAEMSVHGRWLWSDLVQGAIDAGELDQDLFVDGFTGVLLRNMGAVSAAWLADGWSPDRYQSEMIYCSRMLISAVARSKVRQDLTTQMKSAEQKLLKSWDSVTLSDKLQGPVSA